MTALNERRTYRLGPGERFEWAHHNEPPRSLSANKVNGLWLVTKMGAYADTPALTDKLVEMLQYHDSDAGLINVRLSLWAPW
ncbi:hypothetical protein MYCOZU1_02350 [Mycobacterium intracellulare subsp. chimaera]|uniref:Uncharacterized protein n=1 Tax=Mycobacterium intracellulare subsp. chimaera TaxID=222805 RepID=A0A220YAZ7_MYCIT|nr:hypothetical protein MYCOZU2_02272 [Mycobacterium intracellulare subsp. chimaera]ASL20775.1 hypothetical protein MYCOZU1_02350 [Mycobacterium intracellulare subsp. chimaera]